MFSGEIDPINHRGLSAFKVKIVDRIQQLVFVRREFLFDINLVAADKPLNECFIALLVTVDDNLGRVDHTLDLTTKRQGSIDCETIGNWHFLSRKEFDTLRHAVFENVEVVFPHVVNGAIVAIDHAHV